MSSESDKDYATFSLDDTDTSSEERLFVDAALAEDKLPSFDGDFAPYFQDLTTATLFCWIHKHNISTSAYEDLVDIIMRPEFNRDAYWDQYRLRIQKVLDYNDLPGTFKRELGQNRSLSREVWLQDEPFLTITTSQISEKVTEDTLRITKILYKHHAHWHIRDATLSYQHPSEYVSIMQPPSSTMKVYKLFLDIYYDDFRTFRNVYHSLGGVYVQFGNMPAHQRKLLKNHFVLGFVPFGGNFNEFMLPFVSEMKEFEQGKLMKVNGKNSWVIADIPATSRYHHTTDIQFKEISDESTTTRQNQLCIQYGLRAKPNILDRLLRERHLQTPQDHQGDGVSDIQSNSTMNKLQEYRTGLVKTVSNEQELNEDIDDIGLNSALVYSQMGWYELATYTIEESDGIFSKVHLHIGDIVTIHKENNGECYAIIKGIFKYKGNNGKYYVFITIDWFDDTNRIHNVLKCPLYHIQSIQDMR
ncbi:hypothetical protein GLOIN_2v1790377 [Rhizophagus irregularis DAOM 181602=DAOM 197198]|nr:hypothetical protein GLOIN_2v1790377 [Rhizophagus irregularis DAOM 181602=DAOM 197198]